MHATLPLLQITDFPPIARKKLATLQVNLGYTCNQTCQHCHVNAGPNRTEQMSRETIDEVLGALHARAIQTLDLTGGAPELNAHFRYLVQEARSMGATVIDRCNLTILSEPGQEDLAGFLAQQGVTVVASLPCYLEENVDKQRGKGVFERSIQGLRQLCRLGYGKPGSALTLNLVYNPQGPSLPPPQAALEQDYKRFLAEHFDIHFNQLFTLTNMPIARFGSMLISQGKFRSYLAQLRDAYQSENLDQVMCRTTLSVDWQGNLFDCDFNQMLGLPLLGNTDKPIAKIADLLKTDFDGKPIAIADHCFGCTAGQGSSCGGALG